MVEKCDDFVLQIWQMDHEMTVVIGMEYAQMAGFHADVVLCFEDIAVDAHLEGIVMVNGIGDIGQWFEGMFTERILIYVPGSIDNFGRSFPVVYFIAITIEGQKVKSSGEAVFFAENAPFGAERMQFDLLGERNEVGERGVLEGFLFDLFAEVMPFDSVVEESSGITRDFSFFSPFSHNLFCRMLRSSFNLCPFQGIELFESSVDYGGYRVTFNRTHFGIDEIRVRRLVEMDTGIARMSVCGVEVVHGNKKLNRATEGRPGF